jgi:hypothetical protein
MRPLHLLAALSLSAAAATLPPQKRSLRPFHWHMHQPSLWPYESVVQSNDAGAGPSTC